MMGMLWVILFVALTGTQSAHGLPVRPTPQTSIYDQNAPPLEWGGERGLYATLPALVLVITAVGLLFGCTWCYRHKDCKPNEGAENQLFTASATHLHEARRNQPPDSGFSEPVNNNISEDNNNGPISLREMQNIANNNAAAYIVSENEERNRVSRESVVEFEPLPTGIRVVDPLEHCADWFGSEDFPRNQLQYLREIGRGWFGRVVEGELEDAGSSSTVAVKILNQNASLEDKARFLTESKIYRDVRHENILVYVAKCLQEDPWMLIFEFCPLDLQQYLVMNRPKMAILNESGVPLRLMCDVTSALTYLHSRGYLYGTLWTGGVLVRGHAENARAVLGRYSVNEPQHDISAPETRRHPPVYTTSSEVWSLGGLVWEVCAWGATPPHHPPPMPDLPCPYRSHLYQVMQLCWNHNPEARPSAAQVHALINHLHLTHTESTETKSDTVSGTSDFEERWQRLKPNTIPKIDEHIAIIHAPSTSNQHFSSSDQEFDHSQTIQDSLSVDLDTAVSRSSSIMSDKEPLSVQVKSESLTNLHGSLEDVRNIYLTHNEMAVLECHQGNISLEDNREKDNDKSDSSVDPWLKDIIAGSQDDVSYYKDVSDVIKNLDNILNSEKTSSSESSHQASPSRDNLSLDCKKDYPMQSSLVKSPGITNFQNILETGFNTKEDSEVGDEDEGDRDTLGTLSHSFERHSDTISQQTLENLTPETPTKDLDISTNLNPETIIVDSACDLKDIELPKVSVVVRDKRIPKLKDLCVATMPSVSENLNVSKDCQTSCDKLERTETETKSIADIGNTNLPHVNVRDDVFVEQKELENAENKVLPKEISEIITPIEEYTILTVASKLPNAENKTPGELSNDLNQTSIFNVSCYEDKKPIGEVKIHVNEDAASKIGDNKLTISSIIINDFEVETDSPTERITKAVDKEVADIIVDDNETLHEEINSSTENSDERPKNILFFNENVANENETAKSPLQEEASDEIFTVASSVMPLIENKIDNSSVISDKTESKRIIGEKSTEMVESLNLIEYERNICSDKPGLIETANISVLNSNEVTNIPNTKGPEFLENIDVTKGETKLCHSLPENIIPGITDNTRIPGCIPLNEPYLMEAAGTKSPHLLDEASLKAITSNETDLSTVTTASLSVTETDELITKNIEEKVEVPDQLVTPAHWVPSPINDILDEVIFISDLTSPTEIQKSDTIDSKFERNQIGQSVSDIDIPSKHEETGLDSSHLVNSCQGNLLFERDSKNSDQYDEFLGREKPNSSVITEDQISQSENMPEIVQITSNNCHISENTDELEENPLRISPEIVQSSGKKNVSLDERTIVETNEDATERLKETSTEDKCDSVLVDFIKNSNDSTIYMDLNKTPDNEALKSSYVSNKIIKEPHVIDSQLGLSDIKSFSSSTERLEATEYMELPSMREIDSAICKKQLDSSKTSDDIIISSTPITSYTSVESIDKTLENSLKLAETLVMGENNAPNYGAGVTITKLEQRVVPDSMSPFESPTRSHPTDTYDENSSVVLGPFENCALELFKGVKSHELTDLPREELLAFSSNFSEINLETPSPLRDGNFLNEVPDILHDDVHFDDITSISEIQPASAQNEVVGTSGTQSSENSEGIQSETQKHISPSTPPNSPGIFLATSSQQKYLVDIDLNINDSVPEPSNTLQQEIELNQIELQITSKLAMAENENNLNIEYSGPLTVEGLIEEAGVEMPETYLAGNGSQEVNSRERVCQLDEECVKALRNELELKLPLAQVAAIEPQCGGEWSGDLPSPPELIVSYPGVLSPIAEETGQQLSAYDNDTNWNPSTRTDSSESYPEPCNNSTDEATELPTGAQTHTQSTYTIHSKADSMNTYTVQKDVGSSKEHSMTIDSLNASPYKKIKDDSESGIDDKTYNKIDLEKECNCERLSQVSPFLVSPTTDTSAPTNSDNIDNATGVSTLSKTTLPTDAKLSKPTECLSKATSIDSWCSNDTLYNVEENFDDLVVDPEPALAFEPENIEKDEGNSESTDTLTHNEEDKEPSHYSTYIVQDSQSEPCETFSPDSMTANGNYNTYTKAKTDAAGVTPTIIKSESKNSPTKDLAYGTLLSGMPSYSNCTTEAASVLDDVWLGSFPQPELVRRSPVGNETNMTPPKIVQHKQTAEDSPSIAKPCVKKMDSVDITFTQSNSEHHSISEPSGNQELNKDISNSPVGNFMHDMTPSITSTPLTELNDIENVHPIPMQLPEQKDNLKSIGNIPSSFHLFMQSAEVRPQDLSSNASNHFIKSEPSEILLDSDSKTLSRNSNSDSLIIMTVRTPTYSDFENSAVSKPQEVNFANTFGQSLEVASSSDGFRHFENSIRNVPQDLSSLKDASSLLLISERVSSELALGSLASSSNIHHGSSSTYTDGSRLVNEDPRQPLQLSSEKNVSNNVSQVIDSDALPIIFNKTSSEHSVNDTSKISNVDKEEQYEENVIETKVINEESKQSLSTDPPNTTNLIESQNLVNFRDISNPYLINFDADEEMDQPHSIIITETLENVKETPNESYESHPSRKYLDLNSTYDSHAGGYQPTVNGEIETNSYKSPNSYAVEEEMEILLPSTDIKPEVGDNILLENEQSPKESSQGENKSVDEMQCNGSSQKYAVVNFLNETFEELLESNVDDSDVKDLKIDEDVLEDIQPQEFEELLEAPIENPPKSIKEEIDEMGKDVMNGSAIEGDKMTSVTEDFLQHEKKFCTLDAYFPLLSDIRFTGPATEIMSTSFNQGSPTAPTSPECEQDSKCNAATDILKEWDSDSDTHSTNSSSGEFIWKDGDGHETSVVPSTRFEHQRGSGGSTSNSAGGAEMNSVGSEERAASEASGSDSMGSGSGSEGDEVEFVPSSWDCRAAPAKSSLRSLEQATPDSKKRVVFKRQKYHCVYEYPREVADVEAHSPAAYLPDRSTYSEWDPTSVEEAELGYGQLFGAPSPLDMYPLRTGIALGPDYDEDFFISSSARPFESLGIMSTTSQFFPGMHMKQSLLERDLSDDLTEDFPPPPSPLTTTTPSLDFTTPDSGVEDITPGSTTDEEFKKKLPESELTWRPVDSGSSSESVSPSSPGGEALGGLRHTRDKLKLDLPPSPHIPSPRHNRVFNFVLDKPKRRTQVEGNTTPLVMTDETPVVTSSLPLQKDSEDLPVPEPTFSTFGKCVQKVEAEQKIILTDEIEEVEEKLESPKVVEPVKGEGTVLDSGDEDSGIESSSKATLERNKTSNVS